MDPHLAKVVLPIARKTADGLLQLLGTSFAVTETKLTTAGHVTGPSDAELVVVVNRVKLSTDYQDTTDNSVQSVKVRLVAYDPIRDVSVVEVETGGGLFKFPYVIDGADGIPTGTPVVSLGYPHIDTGRLVLTQQTSMVGARVLLGNNGLKTKHVVLNTQTRPGQSGSPIFSSDGRKIHAMIIGGYVPPAAAGGVILAGIDPTTLHQTTHAVSAEYIKAMI